MPTEQHNLRLWWVESPDFVHKAPLNHRDGFRTHFRHWIQNTAPILEETDLVGVNELKSHAITHALPHLIVFFSSNKHFEKGGELMGYSQTLRALREFDPAVAAILVVSDSLQSIDTMTALESGFHGVLPLTQVERTLDSDLIGEAIRGRLVRHRSRQPRAPLQQIVEIKIPSIDQALVAETLNIGTGGVFVRIKSPELKVNDHILFRLEISNDLSTRVYGTRGDTPLNPESVFIEAPSRVAWIRNMPAKNGNEELAEGTGLEFMELAPPYRARLKDLVQRLRAKAFVPQS